MQTKPISGHLCELCGVEALVEYLDYPSLPRVTSDSKVFPAGGRLAVCAGCGTIQKLVEDKWLKEIDTIYGEFSIYHQSGGREQPIFSKGDGTGQPRSVQLVDFLARDLRLPADGTVLDFGCGNGTALRSFGAKFPNWKLYGSELSELNLPALKTVPGFIKLFTVPPEDIPGKFDLVMLFHALEHVIDPVKVLKSFAGILEPGGSVFVEIPNNAQTPYDILIADHMTHFTPDSLRYAADLAGYRSAVLSDTTLPKELTWVGSRENVPNAPPTKPDPAKGIALVESHLTTVLAQMTQAKAVADTTPAFGVFGTSISATWLSNVLGEKIKFYVDEDPGRIGQQHMGKPVFAPADVPEGSDVFLPLIPRIADAVAGRLSRAGVRFHQPR
jgi:SAM-dependent methyltransferase